MQAIRKPIIFVSLFALVSIVAAQHAGAAEQGPDRRTVIMLDEAGRAAILEEMRHHLNGIQTILEALSKNDLQMVAKAARASGMQAAQEAEPHINAQLPQGFKTLGLSMHKEFDAMADEVEKSRDPKLAQGRLSSIVQKCNACHGAFQIRGKAAAGK